MAILARNILCSILCIGFLVPINAKPYSKYGRSCGDIGCPRSEVCVMAYDSCNYGAQENSDCGRYPTCKRRGDGLKAQSSDPSLNPLPESTRLNVLKVLPNPYPNQPNPIPPSLVDAFLIDKDRRSGQGQSSGGVGDVNAGLIGGNKGASFGGPNTPACYVIFNFMICYK